MYQPTITIGDRVAAFAADAIREKADKKEMARTAADVGSVPQTFPNNTFARGPRREEKVVGQFEFSEFFGR